MIEELIEKFLKFNEHTTNIEGIYNEFSLQHELGIFLRNELKNKNAKIYFEKNVTNDENYDENKNSHNFVKKEIDIVIETSDGKKYAIELKFARHKAIPRRYFQFLKDIEFMQQVKENLKYNETYCLTLVNNSNFVEGNDNRLSDNTKAIYKVFRNNKKIIIEEGSYLEPFHQDNEIILKNGYQTEWKEILNKNSIFTDDSNNPIFYYFLKI